MDFDKPMFLGDPPTDQGPIVGVPKEFVDDLVKKLDASRALTKELQAKVDRQRNDLRLKSAQVQQLREDKAKLTADIKRLQKEAHGG